MRMHGAHGCFLQKAKRRRMETDEQRYRKTETGAAGVGVGGVRPAALKFIIHLHSPKHALEATV